jgi:hypothetical protein
MNRHISGRSDEPWQKDVRIMGDPWGERDMGMIIMARRFTIITLVSTVFALSFSAAVQHGSASGAQSHFGASFTCLESNSAYCSTIQ